MRSILFQQPGVTEADIDWVEGRGAVVYDPAQVTADKLAQAVSAYFPTQVIDDQPASDSGGDGQ